MKSNTEAPRVEGAGSHVCRQHQPLPEKVRGSVPAELLAGRQGGSWPCSAPVFDKSSFPASPIFLLAKVGDSFSRNTSVREMELKGSLGMWLTSQEVAWDKAEPKPQQAGDTCSHRVSMFLVALQGPSGFAKTEMRLSWIAFKFSKIIPAPPGEGRWIS